MVKSIKIKDNTFNLSTNGSFIVNYKQQFGREYYEDLEKIYSENDTKESLLYGYNLIWTMSKTYDNSIPDPDAWINTFTEFPLLELIPIAMDLLSSSFSQIKKDEDSEENNEKMTAENLVACCLTCGMSMNDINSLDIGFLINSVSEYVKIKTGGTRNSSEERVHIRKATQSDFDSF